VQSGQEEAFFVVANPHVGVLLYGLALAQEKKKRSLARWKPAFDPSGAKSLSQTFPTLS